LQPTDRTNGARGLNSDTSQSLSHQTDT